MASFDPKNIRIGAPEKSAKGAQIAYLSDTNGQSISFNLSTKHAPLRAPFGASSYNDDGAQRVNLDVTCPSEIETLFNEIDEHVVQLLSEHGATYFKKTMSIDDVRRMFRASCTQNTKEGYLPTLRTKVNLSGSKVVRCWDMDTNAAVSLPDWKGCQLVPRVRAKGIYFMASSLGLIVDTSDVLVQAQAPASSPFA